MSQLAHVFTAFDKLAETREDLPILYREVAATSIAASRFSSRLWKIECIARATKALETTDDQELSTTLACRESSLFRMSGNIEKSESRLKQFEHVQALFENDATTVATARSNTQRAELIVSFGENLIYQQKFEEAIALLKRWEPIYPAAPSTLEGIALRARDITLGKVLRFQGHFNEALILFEAALDRSLCDDIFEGSGWYRVMLSNLAELYCELDQPEKGEKLLQTELEPMIRNQTHDIATGRRLRLSLAQTFIQMARFETGKIVLMELENFYDEDYSAAFTTRICLFQVYIGMARIHHRQSNWDEALKYWRLAQTSAHDLTSVKRWDIGLVQLSIAYILHRNGNVSQSHTLKIQAEYDLQSDSRRYWIAGFNSFWYGYIKRSINDECNCTLLT